MNQSMPIVQFVHIPKCAGTSTWNLLANLSEDPSRYYPMHQPLQERQAGEIVFTVIRDPVERILSLYTYAIKRGDYYIFKHAPYLWGATLYEFVYYLYSTQDPSFYNCMIQFMDGSFPSPNVGSWTEALARIKEKNYDHIGFVDDYKNTISWLIRLFGRNSRPVGKYRLNRSKHGEISREEIKIQPGFNKAIELIIDSNTQDIMLYKYLKQCRTATS